MSSTDEPNSDNYTTVRLPNSDNYTTVRLPKELILEIDDIIRRRVRGYKSRSEFIKEAIRRRLDEVQATSKQT